MANWKTLSKLDEIATLEEQQAWVNLPAREVLAAGNQIPELRSDKYDVRLAKLLNAPTWQSFRGILRYYISQFILKPSETQGKWWNAVIQDKGAGIRINIWRQEVFLINYRSASESDKPQGFGWLLLEADGLERALQSGERLPQRSSVSDGQVAKEVRQKRIVFSGVSDDDLLNLFRKEWLKIAVKTLNIDLFRAGRLQFDWPRFHAPNLLNALFVNGIGEARPLADQEQKL